MWICFHYIAIFTVEAFGKLWACPFIVCNLGGSSNLQVRRSFNMYPNKCGTCTQYHIDSYGMNNWPNFSMFDGFAFVDDGIIWRRTWWKLNQFINISVWHVNKNHTQTKRRTRHGREYHRAKYSAGTCLLSLVGLMNWNTFECECWFFSNTWHSK